MYSVTMDESATTSLSEALAAELQRAIHALSITHRKEPHMVKALTIHMKAWFDYKFGRLRKGLLW